MVQNWRVYILRLWEKQITKIHNIKEINEQIPK
jgi:hypothetical protein